MISVALPGEPTETRLPARDLKFAMPAPSTVTACMRFGYMAANVLTGNGLPSNLSQPFDASYAASTMVNPMSACSSPTSLRLSTEPPVTCDIT